MSITQGDAVRPFDAVRSLWIWAAIILLMIVWLPLLTVIRLSDRDPVRYRTGRWFRRLGIAMTRVNPMWKVVVGGWRVDNPRNPYVVISNHQSNADIPVISHLPWEMKWLGKRELFVLPVVGWMMKLAGDISVDRASKESGRHALARARGYLDQNCSVMIFPEGTRSPDGRMLPFHDGAFALSIRARVPILPVVVDGSWACLPKRSWIFRGHHKITVTILEPVETAGLSLREVSGLKKQIRDTMLENLASGRGVEAASLDSIGGREPNSEGPG